MRINAVAVETLIDELRRSGADFHALPDDEAAIRAAESALNVVFPESYRWLAAKYGHLALSGIEICGCRPHNGYSVVEQTLRERRFRLPSNLIILEHLGAFCYCLDCGGENEDAPVFSWDRVNLKPSLEAPNCYQFLYDRLMQVKEDDEYQVKNLTS